MNKRLLLLFIVVLSLSIFSANLIFAQDDDEEVFSKFRIGFCFSGTEIFKIDPTSSSTDKYKSLLFGLELEYLFDYNVGIKTHGTFSFGDNDKIFQMMFDADLGITFHFIPYGYPKSYIDPYIMAGVGYVGTINQPDGGTKEVAGSIYPFLAGGINIFLTGHFYAGVFIKYTVMNIKVPSIAKQESPLINFVISIGGAF